jgi:hypothetical protein
VKSLFVLHDQPRLGAQLLADIHLRPTLTAACKIMHTALFMSAPSEEVAVEKSVDNVKEFKYKGLLLMPPYPGKNPWVNWAASNYHHFWWLIETAWWVDKELTHRFHLDQSPLYLKMNKIVEEGCSRHFPKPNMKAIGNWPTPGLIQGDEVATYRNAYKKLKEKVRMKWTNREVPQFMSVDYEHTYPECKGPKPITGVCDKGCFYGRN